MEKQLLRNNFIKTLWTLLLLVNVSLASIVFAGSNLFDQNPGLKVSIDGTKVSLNWFVDDFSNVEAVIIERSFNDGSFSEVRRFEGEIDDAFIDYLLNRDLDNDNVAYRIRMINEAGKTSFSNVAEVDLKKSKSLKPEIMAKGGKAEVIFYTLHESKTNIMLFNNTGRMVKDLSVYPEFGNNHEYLDVSNLAPGLYFLRMEQGLTVTTTKFFLR